MRVQNRTYAKVFQQGNGAEDSTLSTARCLNAAGALLRKSYKKARVMRA